jgi:hypothetical protein
VAQPTKDTVKKTTIAIANHFRVILSPPFAMLFKPEDLRLLPGQKVNHYFSTQDSNPRGLVNLTGAKARQLHTSRPTDIRT